LVQQEKEFIRERATMRHKNSSKWVRNALKKKDVDLSVRREFHSLNLDSKISFRTSKTIKRLVEKTNTS
jgi:U3 small nucleolar RNA-associated protein 14